MSRRLRPNRRLRRQRAAEQTHPMSGPRRRPHELPRSFVIRGESGRTTHVNRPPKFPVRFKPAPQFIRGNMLATTSTVTVNLNR
jgi:hypothetical protein